MTEPTWIECLKGYMPDFQHEVVTEPYPHVVLITLVWDKNTQAFREEWIATCDTVYDVMHLALRSGSYVMEPVGDKVPGAVANWFDEAITRLYERETQALKDELGI